VTRLVYTDHRDNPGAWANALGISRRAVDIYLSTDVVDLHVDSFIWSRTFGYDLTRRHGTGWFGARLYGHADFPRMLEAQVTGAIWSITTNPFRGASGRATVLTRNLERICNLFASVGDSYRVVRTAAEYHEARKSGLHGAFLGIQGGNALPDPEAAPLLADGRVLSVTLVHMTSSWIGATSSPLGLGSEAGLTEAGRELVQRLDVQRVLVDLAHVSRRGFWDAVETHDASLPLIVTHTGVCGVHPHWRNLDDDQLRAVANTGGTVGIIYHTEFLGGSLGGVSAESIVRHLAHVVDTVGEDYASLGSDWDGAVVTPRDLPTCLELPRLVQLMLDRGWNEGRIRKILGGNFLRVVAALRG
jgi:membrane dipeptidase